MVFPVSLHVKLSIFKANRALLAIFLRAQTSNRKDTLASTDANFRTAMFRSLVNMQETTPPPVISHCLSFFYLFTVAQFLPPAISMQGLELSPQTPRPPDSFRFFSRQNLTHPPHKLLLPPAKMRPFFLRIHFRTKPSCDFVEFNDKSLHESKPARESFELLPFYVERRPGT